jgi:hypothetical protein
MTVARDARALQAVSMWRVAADLSDAVNFGAVLSGQDRAKVAGFAAGWGAVCAGGAAGLRSGRALWRRQVRRMPTQFPPGDSGRAGATMRSPPSTPAGRPRCTAGYGIS